MFSTLTFWLWAATTPLLILYSYAFVAKTFFTKEKLIKMWGWPQDYSRELIRFIGIAEGAAVIGLFAPILTGVLPWLTDLAAICLTIIQILAIRVHAKRHDNLSMNIALLALSAFVAWGYRGTLGL